MNPKDPPREEELQAAPWLRSLDPEARPPVPAGYFEGFGDRLKARLESSASQDTPPLLQAVRKSEPAVPAGYFDTLPGRVMGQIKAQTASPVRRPSWLPLSLAAAIALLLLSWWAWPTAESPPTWSDISDEALISMVQNEDLGTELLLNALDETSLQALQQRYEQQLSDQDLLEALDDADLHELEQAWEGPWPALSPDDLSDSL